MIRLKKVVLPAPLGPIRAVIEPWLTSIVAPSTAWMPPKLFSIPSASKIGVSVTEDHLLALAEDALRPEGHQSDQEEADEDEPQG